MINTTFVVLSDYRPNENFRENTRTKLETIGATLNCLSNLFVQITKFLAVFFTLKKLVTNFYSAIFTAHWHQLMVAPDFSPSPPISQPDLFD